MYYNSEMEWNSKWGWENLDMFNSKASESLKKLHLTDWETEDEGEIGVGSFKLLGSGSGSGSGGSDSDVVHGYSVKSSISASTDSSPYDGMKASRSTLEPFSPGTIVSETEQCMPDVSAMSSPLETSLVSVEPLIGLKLGKRTYFGNNSNVSNINSPSSVTPVSSTVALKKTRSSSHSAITPRCQVEGCNLDLSSAKEYYRKHRVCSNHSKSPKVIVGGVELRFCQQCSRFHSLLEFDEKKRSCRRRLSDHNARRRKPKQETLQFHSPKLPAPFYDGMQQINFALDNNTGGSTWENIHGSKFTQGKYFPWRIEKAGQPFMQSADLREDKIMQSNSSSHLWAYKANQNEILIQGSKEAMLSSNSDAVPEFQCALSLLSTKSWGETEAECVLSDRLLHANPVTASLPPMHAIPQGIPLASSDYWQVQQQSNKFHLYNFSDNGNTGSHFGQVQHFRSLDNRDAHSNGLN